MLGVIDLVETRVLQSQRRIALLLNLQIEYCRRLVSGIASYANGVGWLIEEMPATPGA